MQKRLCTGNLRETFRRLNYSTSTTPGSNEQIRDLEIKVQRTKREGFKSSLAVPAHQGRRSINLLCLQLILCARMEHRNHQSGIKLLIYTYIWRLEVGVHLSVTAGQLYWFKLILHSVSVSRWSGTTSGVNFLLGFLFKVKPNQIKSLGKFAIKSILFYAPHQHCSTYQISLWSILIIADDERTEPCFKMHAYISSNILWG